MKKKLLIILPLVAVCIVGIVLAVILLPSSNTLPVANDTTTDSKTSQKDSPSETTISSTEKSTQKSTTAKNKKATEKSTQKSTEVVTQKPTQKSTTPRATTSKSTVVPTEKPTTKKTSAPTSPATTVPTEKKTSPLVPTAVAPTEADTIPPDTDDQNLVGFLEENNYSLQTLAEVDCQQIITVSSHDTNLATISLYEKNENGLWKSSGLDTEGFVGSEGVSDESYEGSYKTPYGMYSVGEAFYIDDKPLTNLDIFKVTDKTYWVDDPESKFYNQKVEGFVKDGWNSAEHMIEYYYAYRYGFVINFNMGENKLYDNGVGKGSAIFLHVSYSPTAGCVGVSEDMMVAYLNALDKTKNPYIIIV